MGSMCAYKSLLLALVLSSSSHASHSEGDVNVMSLRGLVEAIFLFEGAKRRVFGCKSYKRRFCGFWLLTVRFFFKEKYLKPHFADISWEGEL